MNKLPDPKYYSLSMLAKRWDCPENYVLHYGVTGQLKFCVLSKGWNIITGYYDQSVDGDYFLIPTDTRWSSNELIALTSSSIEKIASGAVDPNPSFECDPEYICYLQEDTLISINRTHLMIKSEDVYKFEGSFTTEKEVTVLEKSEYTTPYIQLMLKAIQENGIAEDSQGKVDYLRSWFLEQSVQGHKITENEAKMMATFIRMPNSKKGGNRKPNKRATG